MSGGFDDLGRRRVECKIVRELIVDEASGHEFVAEHVEETVETYDGGIETVDYNKMQALACNHVYCVGDRVARCEMCSSKALKPVYVCAACSVTCPIIGVTLCLRCSQLGPDRNRYSPEGLQKAADMGLFDAYKKPSSPGLFGRVAKWALFPLRVLGDYW